MADFCSLCGYDDINIEEIYNKYFKPTVTREQIESLEDDHYIQGSVGGICESCGISGFGSDKNFDVWGFYWSEKEPSKRIIGHINKETMDLTIDVSEDPFYIKQEKWMYEDTRALLKEMVEWYDTPEEEFLAKYGFPKGDSARPSDEDLEKYGLL